MHIPDGFINGATSLGAGVAAAGGVTGALRQSTARLKDRQIPLAGLVAAFVFVLQMINFPVIPGMSGHLLGGALAAILMGPSVGIVVMSVVIVLQALLFADGGVSALGLNLINMGVVTTLSGWVLFRVIRAPLPPSRRSVLGASFAAAMLSVVISAVFFVIEYGIGGVGGVSLTNVLALMAGSHVLIGIGEGFITVAVVGAVLQSRPDLVFGARDLATDHSQRVSMKRFWVLAGAAAVVLLGLTTFASANPDGLMWVAEQTGIGGSAQSSVTANSPLSNYGFAGLSGAAGTIAAGAIGIVAAFLIGWVALTLVRRRSMT